MMKRLSLLVLLAFTSHSLPAQNFPPEKVLDRLALNMSNTQPTPMKQFLSWFQEASQSLGKGGASYCVLATVNNDCEPSSRTMTAYDIDWDGFTFLGDLPTQKFVELKNNPRAAVTFYWPEEQRQINFIGTVEQLSKEEASKYFKSRDKVHQISSLIFKKVQSLHNYDQVLDIFDDAREQFQNKKVPMPNTWGGFYFNPVKVEFWQRGPADLNARVIYFRDNHNEWRKNIIFH